MKKAIFCALIISALSGCSTYSDILIEPASSASTISIKRTHEAVDSLAAFLKKANLGDAPILVASLVQVENLQSSSAMGKILGEQIGARLAARGLPVHEVKLRGSLFISERGGEFVLSREAKNLSTTYRAKVVVAGTYAVAGPQVLITLKAIDTETGLILSGYSFSLPRSEVKEMLGTQAE